jgi:hypothetical protein
MCISCSDFMYSECMQSIFFLLCFFFFASLFLCCVTFITIINFLYPRTQWVPTHQQLYCFAVLISFMRIKCVHHHLLLLFEFLGGHKKRRIINGERTQIHTREFQEGQARFFFGQFIAKKRYNFFSRQ